MATTLIVAGVTTSDAAWANDVDAVAYGYLTGVGGTANAITATGPASIAALAAGHRFWFKPGATNTGATAITVTCNSVSMGSKNIYSKGAACVGGEIISGVPCHIVYDGTQFQIVGPIFPLRFTSAAQTITSDGTLTLAHGLGAAPTAYMVKLTCTSNDINYTAGQVLLLPAFYLLDTTTRHCTIRVDATNLYVRYGAAIAVFEAANGTGVGISGLDNTKWTATFIAWVF